MGKRSREVSGIKVGKCSVCLLCMCMCAASEEGGAVEKTNDEENAEFWGFESGKEAESRCKRNEKIFGFCDETAAADGKGADGDEEDEREHKAEEGKESEKFGDEVQSGKKGSTKDACYRRGIWKVEMTDKSEVRGVFVMSNSSGALSDLRMAEGGRKSMIRAEKGSFLVLRECVLDFSNPEPQIEVCGSSGVLANITLGAAKKAP
ncbi:uncharacterized protein MONOS_12548 [Monocercomonoides exilis]|uniref:uncharacterized protein n=1 Tax=Monocercomonoides exilis TaxID=2049356 RepID=UPI003559F49E|nr:hypothetical protein MONOS_12548 [Monocercomonoides exilis]|eukprot:MONOS_12548.1-p1 / transcript=MONOS_12548.1 / gene=MONOS_12548 / organism=Monocercomonoides_exilis_PA203 / gene_product=unspecified product / transcript_product=unspecified product / location=Mono_scaffold00701:6134-6751(+) / protein_length=206 / sequence_SO=supercontig / SO=protein_coding / is_pseudo=false